MRCERCPGTIRVLQTFSAGPGSTTKTAMCEECETRYTIVSVALAAREEPGRGARSLATLLKNGKAVIRTSRNHAVKITPAQFPSADF